MINTLSNLIEIALIMNNGYNYARKEELKKVTFKHSI